MSQTVRTLVFFGLAVVSVGIGFATKSALTPADLDAFSDVGTEFFPEFTDPNEATGLQVSSFNEETGKTDQFSVEFKDGLWRIPSHHDYPADGEDQLAKTAASMIGAERSALVERTAAAHKRYGLLDPLDTDVAGTEGRGDRITLTKGEEVLADFIVGQPVEDQENVYYVRSADEDRFYTADLGDFDISTKFADWIKKDILDIDRNDVRELFIDRYQVDELKGVIVPGDKMLLNRDSGQDDWKLEGINAETEKVNTSNINTMLLALDDLAIVGVRPKPEGISSGLKSEEGAIKATNQLEIMVIGQDLRERGFFLNPRSGGIVSNEGEVHVGTSDGALYVLRFGEEFSGTDVDIEVGGKDTAKKTEDAQNDTSDSETEGDPDSETETENNEEADDSLAKSRYLFVTAQFDETLLGDKPTPPVKPEPPAEGDVEAEESAVESNTSKNESSTEDAEEKADDSETQQAEKPNPQKQYEEALAKYEEDLEIYELAVKNYDEKMKAGKERVAELNRRFADWYYVISADVFDRMKLNRVDIVEPQDPPEDESTEAEETTEANPLSTTPAETPQSTPMPETTTTPASEQPEPEKTEPTKTETPSENTSDTKNRPAQPKLPESDTPDDSEELKPE